MAKQRTSRSKKAGSLPNMTKAKEEASEFSGLSDKLLSKFDDLNDVLSKVADTMSSINGTMDLVTKTTRRFKSDAKDSKDTFDGIGDSASKLNFALDEANRLEKSFGSYLTKNELISKQLNDQNKKTNDALGLALPQLKTWGMTLTEIVANTDDEKKQLDVMINSFSSMVDVHEDLVANQKTSKKLWDETLKGQVDISSEMTKLKDINEDILDNEKLLMKLYEKSDGDTKIRLTNGLKFIDQQKELVAARESELKHYQQTSSILKKNQSTVDAMAKGITGTISKIPGGEHLAKALKIDGLADNIKKKLSDGIGSGTGKLAGGLLGTVGKFIAGGAFLGAILGPVIHILGEVDAEVSKIGKDFGISRKEADHLHHKAIDLAGEMQIVGINSEQVVASVKTLSESMGGLDIATQLNNGNKAVQQMVKDTAVLTEKFGLSADEVKNIHTLSTLTGKSMGQLTMEATTLGKGLMTNKEALKTLASIPKSVAVAFKGGTEQLIKAAQKAKMLGMELGRVQEIGDGMLDIETSLGKEMEARALTGKNLQLDAARMLALQGDTAGLQDELLRQAGSLEEFQGMNRIQQKAFADAMGMSVDEMTGMLSNAQKLKDLGMSQKQLDDMQTKNAKELRELAAAAGSEKQKQYIEELAKQKESAAIQERFQNILKKVQEKLSAILSPILEIVHGLLDSVTAGDNLNGMIDGIVGGIKALLVVVKLLQTPIAWIMGAIGTISKLFGSTTDATKEAGAAMKPVEASFGGLLGIVTAIGGFMVGKKMLAKGMDMLKEKAVDAGKAIMDKVGGAMGKVADKGKGLTDKIMPSKGKTPDTPKGKGKGGGIGDSIADFVNKIDAKKLMMSAAAILILAAALWVAAKAFQEFGKTDWDGIAKGVVGLLALTGVAYLISKMDKDIYKGAAALLVLGAALWVIGAALTMFTKISWEDMAKAGVSLLVLTGMIFGLGAILSSGVGAVIFGAGVAGFIALGAALMLFASAMLVLAVAMKVIEPMLAGIFDQFVRLLSLDPAKLPLIAIGITAIAGALGVLAGVAAAGGAAAGIGSAIAGLFGTKGPMEMVMEISQKIQPDRLSATAKSIRELADAFKYFATETAKLADFDVDKIDAIIEKMEDVREAQSGGLGGAITGAAKAITGFIGNIFGSSEEQKTTQVQGGGAGGNDKDKLDTVIQLLSQIAGSANQPTVIKFGDKTVEEIKTQLNFKKAYNVNIDNTYGRTT